MTIDGELVEADRLSCCPWRSATSCSEPVPSRRAHVPTGRRLRHDAAGRRPVPRRRPRPLGGRRIGGGRSAHHRPRLARGLRDRSPVTVGLTDVASARPSSPRPVSPAARRHATAGAATVRPQAPVRHAPDVRLGRPPTLDRSTPRPRRASSWRCCERRPASWAASCVRVAARCWPSPLLTASPTCARRRRTCRWRSAPSASPPGSARSRSPGSACTTPSPRRPRPPCGSLGLDPFAVAALTARLAGPADAVAAAPPSPPHGPLGRPAAPVPAPWSTSPPSSTAALGRPPVRHLTRHRPSPTGSPPCEPTTSIAPRPRPTTSPQPPTALRGTGAPCGSASAARSARGKTELVACAVPGVRRRLSVVVVTNDIYTTEDAAILERRASSTPSGIVGVETGCCPHTAIRDDISENLDVIEGLEATLRARPRAPRERRRQPDR